MCLMQLMIHVDSILKTLTYLAVVIAHSGCTSEELVLAGLQKDTIISGSVDRQMHPLVAAFQDTCLKYPGQLPAIRDSATREGWSQASDGDLSAEGLTALRKLVLAIPGGGGRFDEEQLLLSRSVVNSRDVLNLERRYRGDETLATLCDIHGRHDFLKSCEALGRLLNRAPDHNQIYRDKEAHFIRWNVVLDGKVAVISCDKAPNSAVLPYAGMVLSLKVDHARPAPVKSIQPVSAASGR